MSRPPIDPNSPPPRCVDNRCAELVAGHAATRLALSRALAEIIMLDGKNDLAHDRMGELEDRISELSAQGAMLDKALEEDATRIRELEAQLSERTTEPPEADLRICVCPAGWEWSEDGCALERGGWEVRRVKGDRYRLRSPNNGTDPLHFDSRPEAISYAERHMGSPLRTLPATSEPTPQPTGDKCIQEACLNCGDAERPVTDDTPWDGGNAQCPECGEMRTACDYGYDEPAGDTPTAETRARAVWEDFEGRLRYGPAVKAIAAAITAAEERGDKRGYQRGIVARETSDD